MLSPAILAACANSQYSSPGNIEMPVEHAFASRRQASSAVADRIATLVDARLANAGHATFVVSGGSTPGQCFSMLSDKPIDWQNVRVALSDERWVPSDHVDSNQKLVQDRLLINLATAGEVLSIYDADQSVAERCGALQAAFPKRGFACCMVGMGGDGHFASLFPAADGLEVGLDLDGMFFYVPVCTAASPHPRVTMTLAALLHSDEIILFFFGDEKFAVYEQAKLATSVLPVAHLLAQQKTPVHVYWAP